jgi:hypothetical protein
LVESIKAICPVSGNSPAFYDQPFITASSLIARRGFS